MASSFPSINSPQRVMSSLNPGQPVAKQLNKVPLKPGRSLVNWIQLTKSGKDLRKTNGKFLRVTLEELQKHNTVDDAWLSIRGMVYNVTDYIEYHPGGVDEIMKGVGKEATVMFDEVHRWVNYQSMLKECLVGKLVMSNNNSTQQNIKINPTNNLTRSSNFLTPAVPSASSLQKLKKNVNVEAINKGPAGISLPTVNVEAPSNDVNRSEVQGNKTPMIPWFDWYQTDDYVTLVIYNKEHKITREHVICDIIDNSNVFIDVKVHKKIMQVRLNIGCEIEPDINVNVSAIGKVECKFIKSTKGKISGNSIGENLKGHGEIVEVVTNENELRYRNCVLKSREFVTHDTSLYCFILSSSTHMVVPVGCHVYLKTTFEDLTVSRPYTPVLKSFSSEDKQHSDKEIFFIIKHYENGTVTPLLQKLKPGDVISTSNYIGDNNLKQKIAMHKDVLLLAAGTGFTPMVKLLQEVLIINNKNCKIVLLFFNKTKNDVIWGKELLNLSAKFKDNFMFENVLSQETESEWNGKCGRINEDILKTCIAENRLQDPFVYICGPIRFTQLAKQLTTDLKLQNYFIFS